MSKVDEYLRKFDPAVIDQLKDAYTNRKNVNQLKGNSNFQFDLTF